jgi:hypothetical protein
LIASTLKIQSSGAALFQASSGCPDETEKYRQACLGFWRVEGLYAGSEPRRLELLENGKGRYIIEGAAREYAMNWEIVKIGCNYYLYDDGFWHPAFSGEDRDPLTLPPSNFKTYSNFGPGPSRQFTKE